MNADGHIYRYDVAVGKCRIPAIFVQKGELGNPKNNLPKIRDMEIYKDDVFICTVPKSGQSNLNVCDRSGRGRSFCMKSMPTC